MVESVRQHRFRAVLDRLAVKSVRVGSELDRVCALVRTEAVALVFYRREVDYRQHDIPLKVAPLIDNHVLIAVVDDVPAEAAEAVVALPQRRVQPIKRVQRLDELLRFGVARIVQKQPIELLLVSPLDKLRELAAHKQQFFAGVRVHVLSPANFMS